MAREQYQAKEKIVQKMTREGLTEENAVTKDVSSAPGTEKRLCCGLSLYARPALQRFDDKIIDTRGADPHHCLRKKAGKRKLRENGYGWEAVED